MNKWLEILIGLILIVAAVYVFLTFSSWGQAALTVLKGGIVWFVVLIGLLFLLLGISDLKE
ncbi:Uncharacterised protein [uncultured archaeon]|nr:Uncharacterised protein [uncultured archaeon]